MIFRLNSCRSQDNANVLSRWDGNAVSVSSKLQQFFETLPQIFPAKSRFCLHFSSNKPFAYLVYFIKYVKDRSPFRALVL